MSIINFKNLINYDTEKCQHCLECVKHCKFSALTYEDTLKFNIKQCIGCKECIKSCPNLALYYHVNESQNSNNELNLLPSNVDKNPLHMCNTKSKYFSEKIRLLLQVKEMIDHTNFLLDENVIRGLILYDDYSTYLNLNLLKNKNENSMFLFNHVSKVKSLYYFAQYIEKQLSINKQIINLYGVPFAEKIMLQNIKDVCIADIPYACYESFSLYDIIQQYAIFSKLEFNYSIDDFNKLNSFTLTNKYNRIKILKVNNINEINKEILFKYHFVIVTNKESTSSKIDLIHDEDINNFYKYLLKKKLIKELMVN